MSSAAQAIAIVGIGAILPDAPSASQFWQNIVNKRYSIIDTPADRWSIADYFDPDPGAPDKTYSKIGGWVRDFEFDWRRFRMPPKVAEAMDQGQQWAVTIGADTLADYGYPQRPLNTERTAVILGTAMGGELHYITNQRIAFPEFAHALKTVPEFASLPTRTRSIILDKWHGVIDQSFPPITEDSMPGELPNIISGRVANLLNLRGPNFITDAACASSFAALEAAVEMLTKHKVDAVLTGGVDRNMGVSTFVKFCKIGALSATGTRPFGKGADGFVMGEGAATFLLKRLEDAERSGDKIYAVIRGVGGSSDGKGKGITAPNPIGQELAIRRAWDNAELDPATATLVEAHGTSTRVGDVVEVESLNKIFSQAARDSIGLGSAKSNIGHLKAGAGAAGMLKTTCALHHKVLPPTLNAKEPNPNIDFDNSPFYLIHEPHAWATHNATPRRAGISAYGFGGTNFHIVMEEYVPGLLAQERRQFATAKVNGQVSKGAGEQVTEPSPRVTHTPAPPPPRGILALGAPTPADLKDRLDRKIERVQTGWCPPRELPDTAVLDQPERLLIDFGDHDELRQRLDRARKTMGFDNPKAWQALEAQGIFRGSGTQPAGKIAFLFPGQGSQYVNMGRELIDLSPAVAAVFEEADRVMAPILGRPLTDYIFVDPDDSDAMANANFDLMQTAITQPAMLTLDIAMLKLLETYGFQPDMVMGHSLGEYAALIAADIMPFAHALEAAAARGSEMSKVSMEDNGRMAAILAPFDVVEATLAKVDGYAVPANINSASQCVIGGTSAAVDEAVSLFEADGYRAIRIPVSHAFHTKIVAPASGPLRQMLDRLTIRPPQLPLVANVTGDFYPTAVTAIKDLLEKQISSPVQWVKGLKTLYGAGARTFVEVGPKRALRGFVRDVLGEKEDVLALMTNHPKWGALPSFNQALCGLYAAGHKPATAERPSTSPPPVAVQPAPPKETPMPSEPNAPPANPATNEQLNQLSQLLAQALQQSGKQATGPYDRNHSPDGSVIVSGTGLGLPGAEKPIMDPDNALRILHGEQFVDLIPERFRQEMVAKQITRLVKSADGSGSFATINDPDAVIKLAGRPGSFDLTREYGVPAKLVAALDSTTQLAMAAGLDALREAGIPLVQTYKRTTTGKHLPQKWQLPAALRDETGIIFASAFPGGDRFAEEFTRYYSYQNQLSQLELLEDLRTTTTDDNTLREINGRLTTLRRQLEAEPYHFDRRFIFRILAMGHSQFAEYIGARGPNTQINAACASTTQGMALAEDWIRNGRCRRVIIIAADNVTSDNLMAWVGAGFLSLGAAATDDRVAAAALPFDKRRHGTILGMGACAMVLESEDAVRERGMRGIVELLSSEMRNSAFHGSRLDVSHIAMVMNDVVTAAERRFGLSRQAIAQQLVFMSHETYTPARGGSAAAEVTALRETFGAAASDIVVANTKGFTGHPMGVGVEDVITIKILEHGIVPPVPNYREVDPDLGQLNLSRGGRYPVQFGLHLAAGFGSQIAFSFTRRIPGSLDRIDNQQQYQSWLDAVSGYDYADTEVVQRVLRVEDQGAPSRRPAPNSWRHGTGPIIRAAYGDSPATTTAPPAPGIVPAPMPVSIPTPKPTPPPAPAVSPPAPELQAVKPAPSPEPPAPEPEPAHPTGDPIIEKVLAIVADQTGYPTDMLELDLDLEADLGVDTVKQAETFAAIRDEFDIPRRDDLNLRDYNTLEKVVGFVHEMKPELSSSAGMQKSGGETTAVPPTPSPQAPSPTSDDIVTEKVLAIVADQTGYPTDMLELDLDLEADLGVDTVKQAETFAAIRDEFNIPRRDDLNLRDYNTLEKVVGFVHEMKPGLSGGAEEQRSGVEPSPTAHHTPPTPSPQPPASNAITEKVLTIVADQTGYPTDMLELDLDLEADLGVDTVKQAETFAAIREEFDIPRRDDLNLRDYNTLEKVIGFVHEMKPELSSSAGVQKSGDETTAVPPTPKPQAPATSYQLAAADNMPRRVPTATLRPFLDQCKATGVSLTGDSRVVVALDQGGVGKSLINRLEKLGVTVLAIEQPLATIDLTAQLESWLTAGPIQGVYWLTALDEEPALADMTLDEWREANRIRVKNLAQTMRQLYDTISDDNNFLVTATRLGGLHGYGAVGASAPLGGAVTGFTKAYKRERPNVLVKAVDFTPGRKTAVPADRLIAETLTDPGVVEIGYPDEESGERFTVTLREQPADAKPLTLDDDTIFLVTGAAGGITSAIIGDLAAASGGIFYLLDLVPAPDHDDQKVTLFRSDQNALKQQLIAEAKAAGEKPTPVMIDKQMLTIERQEAALRAIETVEAAGGTAVYHSVNLLDGPAIATVVDEIREAYGRIDVLIHAGGIEISKALDQKPSEQFDMVFDIKADGFFSLLKAAGEMPIGATIVFSSVAGRFGNSGQTDYSAANDLLCKLTSSLRRWRPETRGIAIDWTAWGGIGMATRGSIPKIMEMAGIDMLPPEAGVPTVRRELLHGGGEIVVGGALGMMVAEFDETGGLDLTQKREDAENLLLVGEVKAHRLYGGLVVATTLDPAEQPFLFDHAMEGTPLLPGVMGTEAFAELATLAAPGYAVAAVESEAFHAPFKFYRMAPQTLYLSATAVPDGDGMLVHTTLRSARELATGTQEKLHFAATVRMTKTPPQTKSIDFTPPAAFNITPDAIYGVYFHGPAYQVLAGVSVNGDTAVGQLAANLPPNAAPANIPELMAPRLIELCFQTAGVWAIKAKGQMALPLTIGTVSAYRQEAEADGSLYATVTAVNDGGSFNAQVVDTDGNVYVDLQGYRTVQLPGKVKL